jgi:hypothetical protein
MNSLYHPSNVRLRTRFEKRGRLCEYRLELSDCVLAAGADHHSLIAAGAALQPPRTQSSTISAASSTGAGPCPARMSRCRQTRPRRRGFLRHLMHHDPPPASSTGPSGRSWSHTSAVDESARVQWRARRASSPVNHAFLILCSQLIS